ncbi:hypothetical protein [Paraburkholderia caribensis]|uniref:hypothetical protein n=1 Tax=Paraburkholderia caribensis TaxID=75105 RepID=UPI002859A83E|nr:hypothetical protein [Paraburkholderia caribensis]MDR6384001.1 hypothetical protein [Paraburkholderia caribensis]
MNDKRIRFVIKVDGIQKTVIAVRQVKNSDNGELFDLNIHTTSGGRAYKASTVGDLVATIDEASFRECDQHISVHCNTKSDSTNTIKRSLIFGDKSIDSHVQITTGIKKDNLFVPALFMVCGDLSRDRYTVPADCDDEIIDIGELWPSRDQLRLMVVVSQKDKEFTFHEEHPSNLKTIKLRNFSLIFIWSFLNVPSHPQAINFFIGTTRDQGPMRGLDWWEIYNLYTDINMTHATAYFDAYPSTS